MTPLIKSPDQRLRDNAQCRIYYQEHRLEILNQIKQKRENNLEFYRTRQRKYYALHAEQRRKDARDHRAKDVEADRAIRKRGRHRLRGQVLSAYGGQFPACACCGESRQEFLTIDHIAGGGNRHRREIGRGLYSWLRANNYPAGFRVLCHNCNWVMGHYGYCPHQKELSGTSL